MAIHLNPEERNLVLTEMRGLLASINGIVSALAEEDYQKAELAASASGMAMVKKLEDEERTILLKLPIEFKQLGFGTHDQFDKIAEDLRQKKNTKVILRELDKLTQNCVRCHATYKIEF
ncbi:hypothetical protein LPTSP1_14960 [Leptospira johnsonii]|uniref:Cytochrome C n=1 Tax=Leptospira johnsonii TaxID=1917820 RepID=A0A2P2D1I6_9LEPT|nr:hypothetical protein LPTSP1_14960 [Leptospira johnsonii]